MPKGAHEFDCNNIANRHCGSCLACLHSKLLVCSDDGHQATLQVWDLSAHRLVQELGGIRKWNAPTHIAYMGRDRAFWVRDTTLSVLTWAEGA